MLFPVASPKVIENARQVRRLNPVYLDTETTGFADTDVVIEIGIVDANGAMLFDSLVNPNRPIPPASIAVHGITNEMVSEAPQWMDIWPQIEKILNMHIIGMYNAEFDLRLLRQTHQHYGGNWNLDERRVFCAMRLYAAFYGDYNARTNGFRMHKLDQAGAQCEITLPNSHRALDDARLTAAIMDYIAKFVPK
jgi:DNA polymerase-3 subunit epsilon